MMIFLILLKLIAAMAVIATIAIVLAVPYIVDMWNMLIRLPHTNADTH